MAKRKNSNTRTGRNQEDKGLQAIYAKARRDFTAADLQKYTEIEDGVPLEKIIGEMEEIHRKYVEKKRKR